MHNNGTQLVSIATGWLLIQCISFCQNLGVMFLKSLFPLVGNWQIDYWVNLEQCLSDLFLTHFMVENYGDGYGLTENLLVRWAAATEYNMGSRVE